MMPGRLALLIALLLSVVAGAHGQEAPVPVLLGFYDSADSQPPRDVRVGDTRLRFQIELFPANRVRVRSSEVLYIDRFPAGSEMFRDDLEAFDSAASQGSVVFLFAPANANRETVANLNYLGRRFGFTFEDRLVAGEILPERALQGPLGGNVWLCEQGARPIKLEGSDWQVHYRTAQGAHPICVSKRWGRGLLVLMGTGEIDRQSPAGTHNALTLVLWGMRHRDAPDAAPTASVGPGTPGTPAPGSADPAGKATATRTVVRRMLEQPDSDLLLNRLESLRRLYTAGASSEPLTGRGLLTPRERRSFFPRFNRVEDLDGKAVQVDQFRGAAVVVICWATWSAESRELVEELLPLLEPFRARGVTVLGLNLDRAPDTVRQYQAQVGFRDRQIFESQGFVSESARALGITRLPRVLLLDRGGRIAATDLPGIAIPIALEELVAE
ncbi:MAG: TlpA family protein disulfide reductase [Candidatus Sumerlaeia bacterium]|nr:TlpA family protein disulfide reductase [Candidatus Sumerlaeia bacterium]